MSSPGVLPEPSSPASEIFVPVPLATAVPTLRGSSPLTPVMCDERAFARLLEILISRSGKTIAELARSLGVTPEAVRQYCKGRRSKPSLVWFIKMAELCGARVSIEFPQR